MQLVPTADAKVGMCLAQEVRDDRGRILLARGQRLTESVMGRLNRFRVERIYIRDGFGQENPEVLRTEMKTHCEEVLRDSFRAFAVEAKKKRYALDAQALQSLTESVIAALMSNRDPLVSLLDVSTASDRLLNHSVSATILAILLGKTLRVSPDMLNHLGTGMMYHDIGFLFIPEELATKTGTLSEAEIRTLKSHVTLGAAHLVRANMVSKIAGNIVLHHHEMMNGNGLSRLCEGREPVPNCAASPLSAEVYDSLTSPTSLCRSRHARHRHFLSAQKRRNPVFEGGRLRIVQCRRALSERNRRPTQHGRNGGRSRESSAVSPAPRPAPDDRLSWSNARTTPHLRPRQRRHEIHRPFRAHPLRPRYPQRPYNQRSGNRFGSSSLLKTNSRGKLKSRRQSR